MQSARWRRVASAAKNFAHSPLPTIAVWIGDGLSDLGNAAFWWAIRWRLARQASRHVNLLAAIDAALIAGLIALLVWGLS